jgi:hypothetical protein
LWVLLPQRVAVVAVAAAAEATRLRMEGPMNRSMETPALGRYRYCNHRLPSLYPDNR